MHTLVAAKLPGAQDRQKLPDPSALAPALQFWQAVELPSRKYWPPPQQTGLPAGVQWSVVPTGQEPVHGEKLVLKDMKSSRPEYMV